MHGIKTIIEGINDLNPEELELVLKEILMKIDRKKKIESILDEYVGIGEGVWDMDAQEYINELREEDERQIVEPERK